MDDIAFDLDANAFLRLVLSELSFCHRYGQKRSHERCEEGCHFTGYLCNSVQQLHLQPISHQRSQLVPGGGLVSGR